ncbi:hypothetical protein HIO71_10295 [Chryseobacterium aquaticum]|uniref:Lipoprotein n=1 Tax=Chryseobacterium aquaticum TaxID=452084 RepID=A0A848N2L0_9FLAO|nr:MULTISPECIES: hypothetical protein [Chryseobacterium]NMR34596.1 hypothetical protein [Chryseobacterium aquaticum]NRQ46420.1 hypothetical protein [Chryseobacterium sp. C-204]
MIYLKIGYSILGLLIITSCKQNSKTEQKVMLSSAKTDQEILKNIPADYKIEKQENINIDNDADEELIVTAVDLKNEKYFEYWYKKGNLIHEFSYSFVPINYKWFANLDDDNEKEIIRAQGYEDGVDYAIYKIKGNEEIVQLYFNPGLKDSKYADKNFWAYPNDIKDIIVDQDKKLLVSLNNNYPRDDDHTIPDNQKELPFVFFEGSTTQPDMQLKNIKPLEKLDLKSLIKNSRKGNEIESRNSASVVKQIIQDLDGDGIKDKIEVYKNTSLKDQFEQEHFSLPIKIFKGTQNGFELWKENKNLGYSADNNCVSEGFSNIVVKGNYFTIEAQSCYDYNVLVDGFTTFKVENNDIFLYKYGEEYFDKSNHDKEIPSKVWTQKDFSKVRFQDVNESFLRKLKSTK